MLVSMKEICAVARENHFGVPALGVNNEHSIRAAVEAAEEKNSPLILLITYGAHPDFVYFGQTAAEIAKASFVPVATILDHGPSWDTCVWAVRAGLTDMMIDKSSKPYEENAAEVKALFADKGMDIAEEDIEKSLAMANGEEAELSEEELENVSGGMDILTGIVIIAFLAGFAKGASCK